MSKELFVSLTPHETKVAVTEDDQLTEIYYERENEYTLAGSIYKGRVTRVLPGMQSAFVDIGLERDAFLYVSDFFELEDDQDEYEPVKVGGPRMEMRPPERQERQVQPHLMEPEAEPQPQPRVPSSPVVFEGPEAPPAAARPAERGSGEEEEGGREWRGRRRRRGRRGRGFPESKFAHGRQEEPARDNERQPSYGPPPGYQPILLPGESISKYARMAHARPPAETEHVESASGESSEAAEMAAGEERPERTSREAVSEFSGSQPAPEPR